MGQSSLSSRTVRSSCFSSGRTRKNTMKMFAAVSTLVLITLASGHPLATQEDVETSIAAVRDLEETAFAAEPRDAEAFVGSAIEEVRDLKEPEFSAKERNAKALITDFIGEKRDLEATDFSKVFD